MKKTQIYTNILFSLLLYMIFAVIFCDSIFADTLYLKNGTQIEGKVIKQDAEKVIFRLGEGQDSVDVTFFSDEVLRIDKVDIPNFLTLPSGEGKRVKILRPVIEGKPLVSEQAKIYSEDGFEINESKTDLQLEESEIKEDKIAEEEQKDLIINYELEWVKKRNKIIIDELTPLLNKEELDYFLKINSIEKDSSLTAISESMDNLSTPSDPKEYELKFAKDTLLVTEQLIKQAKQIQPPTIFVNYHKKYLDVLNSMKAVFEETVKDMFEETEKSNTLVYVLKANELQNMSTELLTKELELILEKKKNKQ